MDPLIFHNEALIACEDACLSPGQAGLLMGWGVFTTLRLYRGIPFAFDRHWARMSRDAAKLSVEVRQAEPQVRQAVIELAAANGRQDGMARVALVRNQAGSWAGAAGHPPTDLLIFTRELPAWPASYRLEIGPRAVSSEGPLAGVKSLGWTTPAVLNEQAHSRGFDDALLLNEKGCLAECTSANVFLVKHGTVLTPPVSSGCLAGVTREILLGIASLGGVAFQEADLTVGDLATAEEVFISSTTREVAPVGFVAPDHLYPAPGKITGRLEALFREHVAAWLLGR